jgi:hypothetical protein
MQAGRASELFFLVLRSPRGTRASGGECDLGEFILALPISEPERRGTFRDAEIAGALTLKRKARGAQNIWVEASSLRRR